jgi:hypothetical protein
MYKIKVRCGNMISIAKTVHSHSWITDGHPICESLLVKIPTRIDELDLFTILNMDCPGGFEVSLFGVGEMWVINHCYNVATEDDFHFGSADFFMTVRFLYRLEDKKSFFDAQTYPRVRDRHDIPFKDRTERQSVNWSRWGF